MLSRAHQFLFIHVPKTAGNSLQRVLVGYSEDRLTNRYAHHDGWERFELESPGLEVQKHSTLAEYRAQLAPEVFSGLFKFTCVRNPWDRCVSHFFSPHRGNVAWTPASFRAFIDEEVTPIHHFLRLEESERVSAFDHLDAALRFEHLEADFADLCRRLGLPEPRLPSVNASRRKSYGTYYPDDELVALVARRFAPEIERFGYTFGPS